jgi:lipopolysaccharide/colanic/teichoic acid biosynthesis glycosyltransferase
MPHPKFSTLLSEEIAKVMSRMADYSLKRVFDIFGASMGLLLLSPILTLNWLVIRIDMGSPALYRQTRPGLRSQLFDIVKFRTMNNAIDLDGNALPDSDRLTRLGRFLRSTSLDELPELWNVLKGDMSLVGPRPLLMEYLPLYTPEQARRHDMRPGVTGWAQINGRNGISWEEKFALDLWYVDNQSLLLDCKIIVVTVQKVLNREGISARGKATTYIFSVYKLV